MFEGDASFTQVSNAPGGRTYVLKFQSSDQRHFVSPRVVSSCPCIHINGADSSGCRYVPLDSTVLLLRSLTLT